MAQLDLDGFNSGQQSFGGLYKLGDNLERNRVRNEQTLQRDNANKLVNSEFLNSYLNPKEFLTGTINDPYITERLSGILQKGSSLANEKGVNTNMMKIALSSDVNKLMKETQNIREIERQRKESSNFVKNDIKTGVNLGKYNEYFKRTAYYNPDGTLKDLSDIDPTKNYADEVLKNGDIYTPESIDEFVKGAGKNTYNTRLKLENGRGGFEDKSVSITAPPFMIPDKDAAGNHVGFVPKWEYATSQGQNIPHNFSVDGELQKADVRMVTKDVYDSLPTQAKAYLRQEAIKYAKEHDIDPSSPEVDNFQRALAYNEIKRSEKQTSTFRQNEIQKDNTIKEFATSRSSGQVSDKKASQMESEADLFKTLDNISPDESGRLDVTDLLTGINVIGRNKKPLKFESVKFNPKTKIFEFEGLEGKEEIPYYKLASLAATANSNIDKDWLRSFNKYVRRADANNQKSEPKEKPKGFVEIIGDYFKKGAELIKGKQSKPAKEPVFKMN